MYIWIGETSKVGRLVEHHILSVINPDIVPVRARNRCRGGSLLLTGDPQIDFRDPDPQIIEFSRSERSKSLIIESGRGRFGPFEQFDLVYGAGELFVFTQCRPQCLHSVQELGIVIWRFVVLLRLLFSLHPLSFGLSFSL